MANLTIKQISIIFALFLIALISVIVGVEIYHQRTLQEVLQQQALAHLQNAKQIETLKAQADRLSNEANNLKEGSDALKHQVEDEHKTAEKVKQELMRAVSLGIGLQLSMPMKTAISEYYLEQGTWPKSNADLNLGTPESFQDNALKSLSISNGGVITLTYDEKSGVDGGQIQLIPSLKSAQNAISWRCVTSSFENIAKTLPSCTYVAETHKGS